MHHGRRALAAIGIVLTITGCGGAGGGTATAGTSSRAAVTVPAASVPAGPMTAASASAAVTDGAASTGGVCDLVTTDELSQAFGRDDITTTLSPGPPDTCGFTSTDGTGLGAIVFLTAGGSSVFDAVHQGSAITDIPGIGDKAFYSSETQTLIVLKGDAMLTVAVVNANTDDALRDTEKVIAGAAARRM